MKWIVVFIGLVAVFSTETIAQREFVDDRGIRFEFEGKPTIAASSKGVLTLFNMGMGADQIIAIEGLWKVRGSYQDYDNPDPLQTFASVDPTLEELAFLRGLVNLSPSCHDTPAGCFDEIDYDLLAQTKPDYFVYVGGGASFAAPILSQIEEIGVKTIFVDTWFERDEDCPIEKEEPFVDCRWKSMLDLAQQFENLSRALTGGDISDQAKSQKKDMCLAAKRFSTAMEDVHERGIRIGVAKFTYDEGILWWAISEPPSYWVTRTFEELGMPIVHTASYGWVYDYYNTSTWFPKCAITNETNCNTEVAFPVDFWFMESDSYEPVLEDEFVAQFPDRALLSRQAWYFARNDGKLDYGSIAIVLNDAVDNLINVDRLYPETNCTNVDINSIEHVDFNGGLDAGQYACYNKELFREDYFACSETESTSLAENPVKLLLPFILGLMLMRYNVV